MGFADYLSRHPKQKAPPSTTDDTHYTINLMNDFKFILTQNSFNHTSATQIISDKYQTNNLAANNSTKACNCDNTFSLNPNNLQPPSLFSSFSQNLIQYNSKHIIPNRNLHHTSSKIKIQGLPSKATYNYSISYNNPRELPQGYNTIQVATRSRPKHNNYDQNITKRKRAPNKQNNIMNSNKNTIATQTDEDANKKLGRSALRPDPSDPLSNTIDIQQYRKNLC